MAATVGIEVTPYTRPVLGSFGTIGPCVVTVLEGIGDTFNVSWRWIGNTEMLDKILGQKGRNVWIM